MTVLELPAKQVPAQLVDATPSDESFLFIGGVYDRRKTG
jgi:hypothetical protein